MVTGAVWVNLNFLSYFSRHIFLAAIFLAGENYFSPVSSGELFFSPARKLTKCFSRRREKSLGT